MHPRAWPVVDVQTFAVHIVAVQLMFFKRVTQYPLHRKKIDILLESFNHGPGSMLFSLKSPSNSRRKVLINSRFYT